MIACRCSSSVSRATLMSARDTRHSTQKMRVHSRSEFFLPSYTRCARSLNANLIPLAIATSISSLEMVKSLNFFFIGDCPISLFRSPLTVEALMMSPMQSDSKFTDRITKYLTKSAERKTTRASKSKGHGISLFVFFLKNFRSLMKSV